MSQGFGAQKMEAAVEALTSNGSQREPSMEEILASIRRIIEDNDAPAARSSEKTGAAGVAAREVMAPRNTQGSQAVPQSETPNPEQNHALSDELVGQNEAERFGASADVESFRTELRDSPARDEGARPGPMEAPLAGVSSAASSEDDVPAIDRGLMQRLAEVEAVQSAPAATEADDRDHGRELQGEPHMPVAGGAEPADEVKQGILSEYTGRKVAAAFGELNEAFEASRRRNFDQMAEEMLRPMLQDWLDNNLPTIVERLVREEIERIARGG